jgi:hypothetical protein
MKTSCLPLFPQNSIKVEAAVEIGTGRMSVTFGHQCPILISTRKPTELCRYQNYINTKLLCYGWEKTASVV